MASNPPLRVGRFNSPHLVSVLDSITIDDVNISEGIYYQVRKNVEDVDLKQGTKLTGFEILTMAALRIFETENVDIVVLEVGMGGRLDATNIVPSSCILVSALTAVDLDHQAFLGDNVALIAREKASIARQNKPFILGRQLHHEVEEVVSEVVAKSSGTLIRALEISVSERTLPKYSILHNTSAAEPPTQIIDFRLQAFDTSAQAHFPLQGAHQLDNLGTALGVIESLLMFKYSDPDVYALHLRERITKETVSNGIADVKWRGRLSFHTISVPTPPSSTNLVVLVDGAHNPASAKTLGDYITSLLERSSSQDDADVVIPITYILSLSHSPPKTPLQTLSPVLPPSIGKSTLLLRPSIALLPFSPPEGMPWVKPVALESMRDTVRTLLPNLSDDDLWVAPNGSIEGKGNDPLRQALKWAADRHRKSRGLVVLAGSLYLVADFYRLLESGFEKH